MDCTIYVVTTKALIRCMVTGQLICDFVCAYAKRRFSHNAAFNINCSMSACYYKCQKLITKDILYLITGVNYDIK